MFAFNLYNILSLIKYNIPIGWNEMIGLQTGNQTRQRTPLWLPVPRTQYVLYAGRRLDQVIVGDLGENMMHHVGANVVVQGIKHAVILVHGG